MCAFSAAQAYLAYSNLTASCSSAPMNNNGLHYQKSGYP